MIWTLSYLACLKVVLSFLCSNSEPCSECSFLPGYAFLRVSAYSNLSEARSNNLEISLKRENYKSIGTFRSKGSEESAKEKPFEPFDMNFQNLKKKKKYLKYRKKKKSLQRQVASRLTFFEKTKKHHSQLKQIKQHHTFCVECCG